MFTQNKTIPIYYPHATGGARWVNEYQDGLGDGQRSIPMAIPPSLQGAVVAEAQGTLSTPLYLSGEVVNVDGYTIFEPTEAAFYAPTNSNQGGTNAALGELIPAKLTSDITYPRGRQPKDYHYKKRPPFTTH